MTIAQRYTHRMPRADLSVANDVTASRFTLHLDGELVSRAHYTIDGTVVTRHPVDAIRERGTDGVPLVVGTNLDEGTLFTLPSKDRPDVLEAIAEIAPHSRRAEQVTEHVRQRIAQQICGDLAKDGMLTVLRLGSRWDLAFHESLKRDQRGEVVEFDIDPRLIEDFSKDASRVIGAHTEKGEQFVLVTSVEARPVYGRMFQTPFSDQIRNEAGLSTMAVGNIYETDHVNSILAAGRADLCALARPHLADPNWSLRAAAELGWRGQLGLSAGPMLTYRLPADVTAVAATRFPEVWSAVCATWRASRRWSPMEPRASAPAPASRSSRSARVVSLRPRWRRCPSRRAPIEAVLKARPVGAG